MRKPFPTPRHTEPLKDYKRHHYLNDIWYVRSPKMNRRMELDSDLEYQNWCETEGSTEVVALCEHPVAAEARIDSKDHTSIVDMYILYDNGQEEYQEIKYEKDLGNEQTKLQIAVQTSYSERVNVTHRIVTETYLESKELKIRNWKRIIAILNLGRDINVENEMNDVVKTLCERGPIAFEGLIRLLEYEEWIVVLAVCKLLQNGKIDARLHNEDFCYTTIITACNV